MHLKGIIHRDIKPENFLIGIGKNSRLIYMIDFGLAKKYIDPKTQSHIEYKANKNLTGTARYASVNTHLGIEQSRRDDLECLCYVLIYLLKGSLPWQGFGARKKEEKYKKIMEMKLAIPVESLCRGLPEEFVMMLKYCKQLRFDEKPKYQIMKDFLKKMFERENLKYDLQFDWVCHIDETKRKNVFPNLVERNTTTKKVQDDYKPKSKYLM